MIKQARDLVHRWGSKGLSPLVLFDNVFPVLYTGRDVSASIHRSFLGSTYEETVQQSMDAEYQAMNEILHDYGVDITMGAESHLSGRSMNGKLYLHRRQFDRIAHVERLQRESSESIIEGHVSHVCHEASLEGGKLLGYPPCCLEKATHENISSMKFLESLGMLGKGYCGKLPKELKRFDGFILEQMAEIFGGRKVNFGQAIDLLREKDSGLRSAYFTVNFYPCTTGCPDASKVGRAIIDAFREEDADLGRFYDMSFFPSNMVIMHSMYSDDTGLGCPNMTHMNTIFLYFQELSKMLGYDFPFENLESVFESFSVRMPLTGIEIIEMIVNNLPKFASERESPLRQAGDAEIPPISEFMERLKKYGPDARLI